MNTIKELRKEKGLTQTDLAKVVGLDQTAISKWELDKALPDTAILIKLSEFFNVSIDYLLGRSTFYYPDNVKPNAPDEEELLEYFRGLSPYLKGVALDTVRAMAGKNGGGSLQNKA